MTQKFSVGQKVRIRDWSDMETEYGVDAWGEISSIDFLQIMRHLCGRTAVIDSISDTGGFYLTDWSDDSFGDTDWHFEPGALVPVSSSDEPPNSEEGSREPINGTVAVADTLLLIDQAVLTDILFLIDRDFGGIWNIGENGISGTEEIIRLWDLEKPLFQDQSHECKARVKSMTVRT